MPDTLRIDAVTTPAGGTIGMTRCPGRFDLAADLATVAAWRPDLIVSLIEDHEPALVGAPDLFDRLSSVAPWRHFPVVDFGVPASAGAWADLLDDLGRRLDGGGRVLVHCRAGLGRTGMLAASLLARTGMDADEAVATVRHARPGALETDGQIGVVRASAGPA